MMEILTRVDKSCVARAVDADKRSVRFLAQSTAMASDHLVILADAGKKFNREFMKNPIVVPYHLRHTFEAGPVVVGSVSESEFTDEGMFQTVRFAETDLGEQYWILYRDGHMRMVSIAWDANDERETDPKKMARLVEKHNLSVQEHEFTQLQGIVTAYRQRDLSLVAIGADPKAMARAADGGNEVARGLLNYYINDPADGLTLPLPPLVLDLEGKPLSLELLRGLQPGQEVRIVRAGPVIDPIVAIKEAMREVLLEQRGVIGFEHYPLADMDTPWDGAAEVAKADVEQLKVMCAWFDPANPDVKASYKLPHHLAKDGGYKTVWNGVKAAMGALLGARGGIKGISASDRKGIYHHLERHYAEFDKQPPDFREYSGTFGASGPDGSKEGTGRKPDFGKLYREVLAFDKNKTKKKAPNFGAVLGGMNDEDLSVL